MSGTTLQSCEALTSSSWVSPVERPTVQRPVLQAAAESNDRFMCIKRYRTAHREGALKVNKTAIHNTELSYSGPTVQSGP